MDRRIWLALLLSVVPTLTWPFQARLPRFTLHDIAFLCLLTLLLLRSLSFNIPSVHSFTHIIAPLRNVLVSTVLLLYPFIYPVYTRNTSISLTLVTNLSSPQTELASDSTLYSYQKALCFIRYV